MIGQTVSHYKILERIGGGGMGEVYKAEDIRLGRFVALKFLPDEVSQDEQALERFMLEARAAAALSHPHICTVHEIEEHEGVPFIVMEYLDGKNLKYALSLRTMPVEMVVELAIQITEALAVAHAKGIVHRDLKPSNIFLIEGGKAKVLDFGLAKLAAGPSSLSEEETVVADAPTQTHELTTAGTTVGTVAYMSPEQALGERVDARSDIFSLGALLYEMVTGQVAFSGPTHAAIFDKILNRVPVSPVRMGHDIPYEVEQIIFKALEKNKDLRYQSALEMHTDLKRVRRDIESGRSASATAVSAPAPAAPAPGSDSSGSVASQPGIRTASEWASGQMPAPAEAPTATQVSVAAEVPEHRKYLVPALVGLIGILAIALWLIWQGPAEQALTESDVVLLTDFVNTTGDPVFDGTLQQALAVKLEESPFLNIFPERQIRETLEFMGRSPDEQVTQAIGQEVCQRQGIKALITGQIAQLGSTYVVTLTAQECLTGNALAREQIEATSKEQVLVAVGQGAAKIRQELGESLASAERFDAPVEQATTSSLEALKAYSRGMEARVTASDEDAIPLFKRAIELDPNFAAAYARLGTIYGNLDETTTSKEYNRKAFELRDRVSELERLYIDSHYYDSVTGEIDKEIEAYQLWKQTYPRDWTPPNNLSFLYYRTGQFERAAQEGRQAVAVEPNHPIPYTNLSQAYLNLFRLDEAKKILDEALAKGFVYYDLFTQRYEVAFLEGDEATMQRQVEALTGKASEPRILELEAGVAASKGRMREARDLYRRAAEVSQLYGFREQAASIMAKAASAEAAFGNFDRARNQVDKAVEISRTRDAMRTAAAVLARVGATAEAEALLAELEERFPTSTLMNEAWIPLARAAGELGRGDYAQVIERLETARPYERRYLWVIFVRGQAYLLSGAAEQAVAEFQKLLELRGVLPTEPIHTLTYLALGRAHAQSGNLYASRAAYEKYLGLVATADAGLPFVEQARAEYAALPPS